MIFWVNFGSHDIKRSQTIYRDKFQIGRKSAGYRTIYDDKIRYFTVRCGLITRRGASRLPPGAGGRRRASGSGLYFQGGFDRRRKYRAPQQDGGSSPPSATRKGRVIPSGMTFFFSFFEWRRTRTDLDADVQWTSAATSSKTGCN